MGIGVSAFCYRDQDGVASLVVADLTVHNGRHS